MSKKLPDTPKKTTNTPPTIEQRFQVAHKKILEEFPDLEGIVTNLIWKTRLQEDQPTSKPPTTVVTPRVSDTSDISLGFFLGVAAAGIQLTELSTTSLAHAAIANKEIANMDLDDNEPV